MTKVAIGHNSNPSGAFTEADRKAIHRAVKEADVALTEIAASREQVKDIIEACADATGIDKKLLRKIVKTAHKASFEDEKMEYQTFSEAFDTIMNKTVP